MSDFKPLAVLEFTVLQPVGINAKLLRRKMQPGRARRLFTSKEHKAFENRVAGALFVAKLDCPAWPRHRYAASRVTLHIQIYDTGHDAEACHKSITDTLQRCGLFANDKICSFGAFMPPIKDGRGRRVVVRAELLEIHDPATWDKREQVALDAQAKRMKAKTQKRSLLHGQDSRKRVAIN